MAKWLSKDPDAYLPDRPPYAQPYLERAREHALRRDGPPYRQDWRLLAPPWLAALGFAAFWALVAYGATVLAGATASIDTLAVALPIVALCRSDAVRYGGAALNERRDRPTWSGHPFGGAPWLAVFAVHLICVVGIAVAVALVTADEANERLAVLASGFVAGGAGWLLDLVWGRSERRGGGLPPARRRTPGRRSTQAESTD